MSRLLNLWLITVVLLLCALSVWAADEFYKLVAIPHKGPKAVIHIDFKEKPQGFHQGQFYIYKVMRVTDTGVEMGLCRLEVIE